MRILKWLGIGVAAVLIVVVLLVAGLNVRGRSMASSAPPVALRTVAPLTDSVSLARGQHLVRAVTSCEHCHDAGLGGKPFPTPGILLGMAAPNLTRGQGGVGAAYAMSDWNQAVRHGIAKDGRRLAIMPSEAYAHLTDADFAAIVAYIETLPPVDRSFPPRRVGVLGGALIGAGAFMLAPQLIDHDSVGTREVTPAVDTIYGRYLANIGGCRSCHRPDLRGAEADGDRPAPPSLVAFAAANSLEDFRKTLRTGRTPTGGGRALNPEFMPWPNYARMTDDEIQAIWMYVQSVAGSAETP